MGVSSPMPVQAVNDGECGLSSVSPSGAVLCCVLLLTK